jgi:DNA-binding CsgD family transcriptional regulator
MLQKLAEYIRQETWDMPSVFGDLLNKAPDVNKGQQDINLTPREVEVLKYFSQGKTLKNIAELLSINYQTVRSYINTIKNKLHINNNVDLIKYAIKNNYTSISS